MIALNPDGTWEAKADEIAEEEPLELRFGKKTLAVTMRTPGHDQELAIGFLLSESVINRMSDLRSVQHCRHSVPSQNRLKILFAKGFAPQMEQLERYGTIHSSCGVCGKKTIDAALSCDAPLSIRPRISPEILLKMPELFALEQKSFHSCGGLHAAALFDGEGRLLVLREDIGRHNAVDKVIGWSALQNYRPLTECTLMVSGRISFEIIQKAYTSRISVVAAVSAPSTLAIQFARRSGQTLIGFLRPPRMNVYSHIENLRMIISNAPFSPQVKSTASQISK